jgi:4-hydroxy-tetrahydrodipicolinate synthase
MKELNDLAAPSGVIVAMDTPFSDTGEYSSERTRRLVDFLLARKVSGLFIAGGTGLGGVLSIDERLSLTETVMQHVPSGFPVLVHVGSTTTADSIALVQHAAEHRAPAAVLSSPEWFHRHEIEAVTEHFQLVCEAAPSMSMYFYRRSWDSWSPATISTLQNQLPNIVGVKDSANDITLHLEFLALPRLAIFQGYEPLATASILAGARGLVSGLATIFPEAVVSLYNKLLSGDLAAAKAQQALVNQLVTITYKPSPYRRFKAVLHARGCPVGEVRRPFRPIDASEKEALMQQLQILDVL